MQCIPIQPTNNKYLRITISSRTTNVFVIHSHIRTYEIRTKSDAIFPPEREKGRFRWPIYCARVKETHTSDAKSSWESSLLVVEVPSTFKCIITTNNRLLYITNNETFLWLFSSFFLFIFISLLITSIVYFFSFHSPFPFVRGKYCIFCYCSMVNSFSVCAISSNRRKISLGKSFCFE